MGRPRPFDRLKANESTLIMAGRISSVRGDPDVIGANHGAEYSTGLVALRNLNNALHNNGGVTRKRAHARCGPAMAAPVAEEGNE